MQNNLSYSKDSSKRTVSLPQLHHWAIFAVVGFIITVILGLGVKFSPLVIHNELMIDATLENHHGVVLDFVTRAIATLFSPVFAVVILGLTFVFLLFVRKSLDEAVAFVGITSFGWFSTEVFKFLVGMPRPDGRLLSHPLFAETGHDSFPSGHTTFVAAYGMACILLTWRSRWRFAVVLGVLVAVLITGASRMYGGAHYLSDTVGAVVVAASMALVFAALWNRFGPVLMRALPHVHQSRS